jgi:hypothetical protein
VPVRRFLTMVVAWFWLWSVHVGSRSGRARVLSAFVHQDIDRNAADTRKDRASLAVSSLQRSLG